jgi:hypothetical protein
LRRLVPPGDFLDVDLWVDDMIDGWLGKTKEVEARKVG